MQIRTESDNPQVKVYLNLADEWNNLEGMNIADDKVARLAEGIITQASYLLKHYPEELRGAVVFTKTYSFGSKISKRLAFPT